MAVLLLMFWWLAVSVSEVEISTQHSGQPDQLEMNQQPVA
jgi:hypothetical protein